MGSPALFSGTFVKFLKNKLNLFDAAYILTGTQDPRVSATDAPKGSILLRQTASGSGQVFVKQDNGTTVNWSVLALDTVSATALLESLKNELVDSPYELLTPNLFGLDAQTKVSSATATWNGGDRNYEFSANLAASTWTARTNPAKTLIEVIWVAELDLFVACGLTSSGSAVLTSPDGITWTARTTPTTNGWHGLAWSPSLQLLVAVSQDGVGTRAMTSPDGITWTARTTPGIRTWLGVAWSPDLGLFAAVASSASGSGDVVMTSPDGITWTGRTAAALNDWQNITWSSDLGLFVAVSSTGTGNRVMTSYDGINWTSQVSAADNSWRSVEWSSDLSLFVAVAASGTGNRVMTSSDGVNWTTRTSAADNGWTSVIWVPDAKVFVAVAQDGTFRAMTSSDGITWTIRSLGTVSASRIAWSNKHLRLVVAGQNNSGSDIYTSDVSSVTSVQMLDSAEFLGRSLDIGSVDLTTFWETSPNAPSEAYAQVSRDGGTNWFPATLTRVGTTGTFRGNLRFDTLKTTEAAKQTVSSQLTANSDRSFNTTFTRKLGQQFTISAPTTIQQVVLQFSKTGSPVGNAYVSIVRDNAGAPSDSLGDVLCQSNAISISAMTILGLDNPISLPSTVLLAGTYHIVVSVDATYLASYSVGVTEFRLRGNQFGSAPFWDINNGTNWTASADTSMYYRLKGRALDLRVRVLAPDATTYTCSLDGYGIFYNLQDVGIVGASRKTQRFAFNSVTDNTSSFAITAFTPDPDLLSCYWVEGGQVFKSPAFELQGNTAVFPANSFNNGGVSAAMTLIFDQNTGGAYDNSDSNARLLAANFLGSTNGADDRSSSGRGIFLRRPDGTLREIALDDSDNLIVYSV